MCSEILSLVSSSGVWACPNGFMLMSLNVSDYDEH